MQIKKFIILFYGMIIGILPMYSVEQDSIAVNSTLPVDSMFIEEIEIPYLTVQERIMSLPVLTHFPYSPDTGVLKDSVIGIPVSEADLHLLPFFTWGDFNCKMEEVDPSDRQANLISRFRPLAGNYELVCIRMGSHERFRDLLVTFNKQGEVIDWIEAGAFYSGNYRIDVRQWSIDRFRNILVSELQPVEGKILPIHTRRSMIKAQRVDTAYKISNRGYFNKTRIRRYQIHEYPYSYLTETDKKIFSGSEIVLP